MTGLLTTIKNWVQAFWDTVLVAAKWCLDGFILLIQFAFYTIIDGLLLIIESLLAAINLSSVIFNYAAAWSHLPDQLIYFINALGLPQCLGILGSAYIIRLTLNLIPSWATRV